MATAIKAYSGSLSRSTNGTSDTTIYTAPAGRVGKVVGAIFFVNGANGRSSVSASTIELASLGASASLTVPLSEASDLIVIVPPGEELSVSATVTGASGSASVKWGIAVIEELTS